MREEIREERRQVMEETKMSQKRYLVQKQKADEVLMKYKMTLPPHKC